MKIEIHIDDRIVGVLRRVKATLTKRRTAVVAAGVSLCGLAAVAQAVTKPYNFTAGSPALASEVNANFNALFDAVTDVEQKLDTLSSSSVVFPANSFFKTKGATSFDGYAYLNSSADNIELFGSQVIQLPAGTVMTNLTCYYYNNSDIVGQVDGTDLISHFTTLLRRKDLTDLNDVTGDTLGTITVWPPKSDGIQEFSTDLGAGVEIEPGSSYYLHMDVSPGDDVPTEDFYPATVSGCAACNRLIRHYGCRIDYELP
jgi:hypothetical protein